MQSIIISNKHVYLYINDNEITVEYPSIQFFFLFKFSFLLKIANLNITLYIHYLLNLNKNFVHAMQLSKVNNRCTCLNLINDPTFYIHVFDDIFLATRMFKL